MKNNIIEVLKKKHRMDNILANDLYQFVKAHIDPSIKRSDRKSKLVDLAEDYLTEDTLKEFFQFKRFGLALCDLPEALDITKKVAKELTTSHVIPLQTTIDNYKGEFKVTTHVYSMSAILDLESKGLIPHKKKKA